MSLFSQEKVEGSPGIYLYLFIGGLGSLLILFLIQKGLPFNQRKAKQYYQAIQTTQQEVLELEKDLLESKYSYSQLDNSLSLQLELTNQAINSLQVIPNFLSKPEQNNLKTQLKNQSEVFDSQLKLIYQFQNSQTRLNQSCLSIPELKNVLVDNPQILGSNLSISRKLLTTLDSLFTNTLLYCYSSKDELALDLENQIIQINELLKQESWESYKFVVAELISSGQNIIQQKQNINNIFAQISLQDNIQELRRIESSYLEKYQNKLKSVNTYRLFSCLLIISSIIFIAYKVISSLAKTNRGIVKVLEGFTQELETKVEQRTAQLEESIQNTEAALAQAQNANKAKSRFLANMSHELRTPLNAILGFTQLMCRDSSMEQEHQENLKIINRSGEHLLRLINDILEMSKIEVGQITLNESKFDLYKMLDSLEEMLRLKAQAKNLELIFKIAKNVPQHIYTDEGKLRQIIINLLGNSLKFTEKGSITLIVKLQNNIPAGEDKIDFLFSDTYSLYFAVEDTGPGIESNEMEQLFSPFEQTKVGRVSNEGTGLGLSICHKFVDLMGGELQVKSVVGKGSTFFFNILVRMEKTMEKTQIPQSIEPSEITNRIIIGLAPNQPQYRILAVDDVPASRLLLRKLLTEIGFAVKEAGDGQEAIDLWQEWHPDLILMDMRMPLMDGYEATRQIKSQPKGDSTIIIALTASAFEEERVVILSAGCDDFMRKPFYETELLEKIGQYLEIDYLYQDQTDLKVDKPLALDKLTQESLTVMSLEWRSQLYEAAAKVDNQEIFQLLAEIPEEYESLAKSLESLAEHFRCDKIIDLAKPVNQ